MTTMELVQQELMKDPILRAFYTIATIPLGGNTDEEYMEMKKFVLGSLDTLAKAGGWQKQMKRVFELLFASIDDPEFIKFLKEKAS